MARVFLKFSPEKDEDINGISAEHFAVLEKIRLNQREDHLKVIAYNALSTSDSFSEL